MTKEEIIKKHIPNGIVNIKGKGDGKPQYKAEIAAIEKCMDEYSVQESFGLRKDIDMALEREKRLEIALYETRFVMASILKDIKADPGKAIKEAEYILVKHTSLNDLVK